MIVMCAFGAHSFKEITRSQLASAAKFFMKDNKKNISKAEKHQLVGPLASVFIDRGILVVRDGAKIDDLTRSDVSKEKTF